MILGILSDSHGEVERTRSAVAILQDAGATALVHCGDIGTPEVLDQLAGHRAWVVCGNIDYPNSELERHADNLRLPLTHDTPLRLELAGRRLAIFHGHEPHFAALVRPQPGGTALRLAPDHCEYVLHGHTHIAADVRIGNLRVINPGALHRAVRCTVATLDLATGDVRFWPVPERPASPGAPAPHPL